MLGRTGGLRPPVQSNCRLTSARTGRFQTTVQGFGLRFGRLCDRSAASRSLPAIPDELAALPQLATNLHWTLGRRGDPLLRPDSGRAGDRVRRTRPRCSAPPRPSGWPSWPPTPASPTTSAPSTAASRPPSRARRWFGTPHELAAALGRLLLAGVRHHRGPAAVLRRPRRARRRPPQGVVRPRRPARRRRPALHRGLLPPAPRRRRLAAGERRRASTPTSLGLADTGVEVTVDLAGDPVHGPRLAGRRRAHPAVPARHRRRGQLARRRRRHRPPLRRRRAPPPAPGDRPRHRRRARRCAPSASSPTCST